VASVCIILYIAAAAFGAIRIIVDMGERRSLAEQEFNDLADRSSSAVILEGFMSNDYQETIRGYLNGSQTLLGVIISGSGGEYAFERYPGSIVVWVGESPRFKTGFGLPGEPFYRPLRIEGQRNGTIRASYSYINYDNFLATLRNTLIIVLITLGTAVLTLILETALKGPSPVYPSQTREAPPPPRPQAAPRQEAPPPNYSEARAQPPRTETKASAEEEGDPKGLFSPRGNIGWESYTLDRLASELHRCASFEQDLVFIVMEFKDGKLDGPLYKAFAEEAVNFFTLRDLIFERGEQGVTIIAPNIDLDQGFLKSEEFRDRVINKLPDSSKTRAELCIGLSSRSGRLIEADRIMFEASEALQRALADPVSPVVAFKSDPEKYRDFIRRTHTG
jgi:hypothetical protein